MSRDTCERCPETSHPVAGKDLNLRPLGYVAVDAPRLPRMDFRGGSAHDALMDDRARARTTLGYILGLVGAVGFVVGAFLPFYGFGPEAQLQRSLYLDFTNGGMLSVVGGWLLLFGGVVVIAWLAFSGLPSSPPRPRPVAFIAGTVTWAVTWIGLLLVGSDGYALKVGFWTMLLAVGVVLVGAITIASALREGRGAEQEQEAVKP